MEEGKTKFGYGYSLEYVCSFTVALRLEMIGPLADVASGPTTTSQAARWTVRNCAVSFALVAPTS